MLVICNGVMKGGSTWLVQIIRQMGVFQPIPQDYQNKNWHNPSLDPAYLLQLNDLTFHRHGDYYCKQHFHRRKFLKAVSGPDLRLVNVIRDLRDMAVSWVFHQRRLSLIPKDTSFDDLFQSGLLEEWLQEVIRHQRAWHGKDAGIVPHLMSYEALHVNFDASIRELIRFLDHPHISYSKSLSRKLYRATDHKKVAAGDPKAHVRKGMIGDYQNYLSEDQEWRICELARNHGYGEIKDQMRRDFPHLEPFLQFTDVGLPGRTEWHLAAE